MALYIERLSAEHTQLVNEFACAPEAFGANHRRELVASLPCLSLGFPMVVSTPVD